MCPEYGATIAIFPIDAMTLDYLRLTARDASRVELVEAYAKAQGLFRNPGDPDPVYSETIELDLATIEPSLAGPKRPQDRVSLKQAKSGFQTALGSMLGSSSQKGAEAGGSAHVSAVSGAAAAMTSEGGVAVAEPPPARRRRTDRSRRGRHRRDHELHEHVEPERDDRRRPASRRRRSSAGCRPSRG